jgi:hypothetical protein
MGYPSVFPTGALRYDPSKCFNGYTIISLQGVGSMLLDMNGGEVRVWHGPIGFPCKMFPGGHLLSSRGERSQKFGFQDQLDLVQFDWDGNTVWEYKGTEYIEDPGEESGWQARQHHDFQREGSTTGYYAPGSEPRIDGGNTLVLCHKNLVVPKISDKLLVDDFIVESTWEGERVWEWTCSDHFDELGFDAEAINAIYHNPNLRDGGTLMGDWMHTNSMSVLGPNPWYDAGDERFHPDNIIIDGRETNILAIIEKKTGKIVWRVGPDYSRGPEKQLGWIVGQHHCHMIPQGLPGAGNILVYDNGGWGGYGSPNAMSCDGTKNVWRDYTRILEFNPVTLEIVWQHTPREHGNPMPFNSSKFYSPYVSSAQRLPNGNTFICEGSEGHLMELTADHELVWEWLCPYFGFAGMNMVYRAYRVPYEWVPQAERSDEKAIEPLESSMWRVPGASSRRFSEVEVPNCIIPNTDNAERALCIGTSS